LDCGDWRNRRCGQNRRLPVCNVCRGLHLDQECPRGVGSWEDLEKRKREVERLIKEKEVLSDRLRTIEEEMDDRYPKGGKQNPKKFHEEKGGGGKSGVISGKSRQESENE